MANNLSQPTTQNPNPWNYSMPTANKGGWGNMNTTDQYLKDVDGRETALNPYYGLQAPADYGSAYNPDTMAMTPGLSSQLDSIQMDKSGLNKFRGEAMRTGPSAWADSAVNQQRANQTNARERGMNEVAGQTAQAQAALASSGGLTSGARERTAEGGAKNYLAMSQDLTRQGNLNEMQIGVNDEQNRMQQLGMLPGMEQAAIAPDMEKAKMWQTTRSQDLANQTAEAERINAYNQHKSDQQNQVVMANNQANATMAASKPSSCCFIFLEARYGNGTMDKVVRRFRDENMTEKNRRGYYKLAEVLVPAMRKSKFAKFMVRALMTDPMVAYGRAYYGGSKLGLVFKPVVKFWLNTFNYLGGEHKFLRENGEFV